MKSFFSFILLLLVAHMLTAQEVVSSLNYNPALYSKTAAYKHGGHGNTRAFVSKGNLLIETDTLKLPFIDDFSTNRTIPNTFTKTGIYDSIINAIGPCDTARKVTVISARFMLRQSWDYTYDTILHQIDSTPKAPIIFRYFGGTDPNCFYATSVPDTFYPEYYTYVFDTIHGKILSQTLMGNDTINPDTIITYAPVLYKGKLDSSLLWVDNYAYVNNTYPLNPPTIGVATLDGLNDVGLPYNKQSPTSYGVADYLTSKPIDLSGLSFGDSVYLSFYYEAQGLGDWPNKQDSLEVEFLNTTTSHWDKVWAIRGDTVAPSALHNTFQQVLIVVPDTGVFVHTYFYNAFQFRFKNLATLAGNNDHWHIDYVRLNKGRNFQDTTINDISFVYSIPSLLRNYEEMPAKQFTGKNDLIDTLKLVFNNVNYDQATTNPPATDVRADFNEQYPNPQLLYHFYNNLPADTFRNVFFHPAADFTASPSTNVDSIVLYSQSYLSVSNSFLGNDTIARTQTLNNVLAYDDGSAERAYGLENLGIKKFAYQFFLNKPDTLVAYQILYSNIDVDVSDLVFSFNIWKKQFEIQNPKYVDTAVYTSTNKKPYYIDSVNGFTTYKLDSPLVMSDSFYFGWAQSDVRNLQVGLDMNSTKGRQHMYIFTSGTWKQSSLAVNASPMIRLIFGHYDGNTSSIREISANTFIKVYPNPATSELHFDLPNPEATYDIELYDAMGRLAKKQPLTDATISIRDLSSGIYMLRVKDMQSGAIYQNKIVKN